MLNDSFSMGRALKTDHKHLNLDDNEDGDLIHTSDDEISETESKANSIIAIFNYEKQDYYLKNE